MNKNNINANADDWRKLPEVFIWTMYHLQLKRIGKNIKQAELSFLLGKPMDYVAQVEKLKGDYTITELAKLTIIYGDDNNNNIFPKVSRSIYNNDLTTSITAVFEHERYYYHAYTKNHVSGDKELLYQVIEFDGWGLSGRENKLKEKVSEYIDLLLEQGYFKDGMEPVEIYLMCKKNLKDTIYPRFIRNALDKLIAANKLFEKTVAEFQNYYYQQV